MQAPFFKLVIKFLYKFDLAFSCVTCILFVRIYSYNCPSGQMVCSDNK